MKFNDFKNKRITVVGLGLLGGGVGAARFFCENGARVTVTDLKTENELQESIQQLNKFKINYVLGGHREEDFINADLVIYGPGVRLNSPYLKIARENNVKLDTDIGIFFNNCPCPIIGITGTKGKSTMTTLVYELLKSLPFDRQGKYKKIFLGGNIQKSVLEILPKLNKKSLVVLELSSWQLEGLARHRKSPDTAIVTNILPDHLNTYDSFNKYFSAKKNIYKYQRPEDFLILNYDDKKLRRISRKSVKGNILYYSFDENSRDFTAYVKNGDIFYKDHFIYRVKNLKIEGEHNLRHILGALTAISRYNVLLPKIRRVISNFKGIPGRLEKIIQKNGIEYINDTTATNPDAVVEALKTKGGDGSQKKIVLICGGVDKNLDSYRRLAKYIKKFVKNIILLPGTASEKLKKELVLLKTNVPIIEADNINTAVKNAIFCAVKNDVVIFSPGAASFNLFKNEFDRGDKFIASIKANL
ncbi:MAG: UDP-N-acetylmuramoylalanine--D-glutamate ligase [Parcubacteria group bacterium GW2011_GWA2_38_13b]|nr:MAG: UDP-N-acetylmuramoylalanine--D-glutamate ligase [Parcubacteria group bacterium GW2011_GWA2_38_13b]